MNDARDQELEGLKKVKKLKEKKFIDDLIKNSTKTSFTPSSGNTSLFPPVNSLHLIQTETLLIKQQQGWTLHLELVSTPHHPAEQQIWKQTVQTDNQTPEQRFYSQVLEKDFFYQGYSARRV